MPIYKIRDDSNGTIHQVEMDSPPTSDDVEEIFSHPAAVAATSAVPAAPKEKQDALLALFPKTTQATEAGKGFLERTGAGLYDVATLPGRAITGAMRGAAGLQAGESASEAYTHAKENVAGIGSTHGGLGEELLRAPGTFIPIGTGATLAKAGIEVGTGLVAKRGLGALVRQGAKQGLKGSVTYAVPEYTKDVSEQGFTGANAEKLALNIGAGAGIGAALPVAGKAAMAVLHPGQGLGNLMKGMAKQQVRTEMRPGQYGTTRGYDAANALKHDVIGKPREVAEKAQEMLAELNVQAKQIGAESPETVNLSDVLQSARSKFTEKDNVHDFDKINTFIDGLEATYTKAFGSNEIPLADAMNLRTQIGDKAAFVGARDRGGMVSGPGADWKEKVFNSLYMDIRDQIHAKGGEELKAINKAQSELIPVRQVALRRMPISESNNVLSLSDIMAGRIGQAAVGGVAGAGVGASSQENRLKGAAEGFIAGAGLAGLRRAAGSPAVTRALYKVGSRLAPEVKAARPVEALTGTLGGIQPHQRPLALPAPMVEAPGATRIEPPIPSMGDRVRAIGTGEILPQQMPSTTAPDEFINRIGASMRGADPEAEWAKLTPQEQSDFLQKAEGLTQASGGVRGEASDALPTQAELARLRTNPLGAIGNVEKGIPGERKSFLGETGAVGGAPEAGYDVSRGNAFVSTRLHGEEYVDDEGYEAIKNPYVLIDLVSVPVAERNKGIASEMLEEVVKKAHADGYAVRLSAEPKDVGMSQSRLVDLYERLGFSVDKEQGGSGVFMTSPAQRGPQAGSSPLGILGGTTAGGLTGATAGAQIGDTPEERKRNAMLGLGVGMIGGGVLGQKLATIGEKNIATQSLSPDLLHGIKNQVGSVGTWTPEAKGAVQRIAAETGIVQPHVIDKWIKDVDNVAATVIETPDLQYMPSTLSQALKQNSDPHYAFSLDFSTLCKKRAQMQSTMEAVQEKLGRGLTPDEFIAVRKSMQAKNYEVSCGLCYVESRRMYMGEIADKMALRHPELPKEMFMSQEGLDALKEGSPQVYTEMMKEYGPRGIKAPESRTEYRSDILRKFEGKPDAIAAVNARSGQRWQSWSDFELPHTIDGMQAIGDMAALGMKGHAYTKVPEFVDVFGKTGMMINMSIVPKGSGIEAGKLVFDPVEGMAAETAFALRKKYPQTAGTIAIGIGDDHILAMLKAPEIDYIIPYHHSGLGAEKRAAMGRDMNLWKDYTAVQSEKVINPAVNAASGGINKVEWAEYNGDTQKYLALCAERGLQPKFPQFSSHPNYYKLLTDVKMYDNAGNRITQKPVQPIFDGKMIQMMLKNYHAPSVAPVQEVVNEFAPNVSRLGGISK